MSIEFRYRNFNPFFIDSLGDVLWNRALPDGKQNIRFNTLIVIKEDSPLFPLHAVSFTRVTNRERKMLLVTDIGGEGHFNPSQGSEDGLGILKQQGLPDQTHNEPPFAIVPIWPCIEQWKKITNDAPSSTGPSYLYSPVFHPEATRDDIRNMRAFHHHFRVSNSFSPSSRALKTGLNFTKYDRITDRTVRILNAPGLFPITELSQFLFLYMAPDMDYPQENEMFTFNNAFDSTTTRAVNDGNVEEPDNFSLIGPLQPADDVVAKVPQVISSSVFPTNQKVVSLPTIQSTDTNPGPLDPNWTLWNAQGVYFRVIGTPHHFRDNPTRYRHDFNRQTNFGGASVSTSSSGVTALTFNEDEDYFQDTEYSQKSEASNFDRWETDNATGQVTWSLFETTGRVPFVAGALVRHRFDQLLDRIVPSKYNMRYNQGTLDSGLGYFLWDDWQDGQDALIDYFAETVDISPVIAMRTSLDDPTFTEDEKFIIELGRKGGREDAYKIKFHKTASQDIDITVGDPIDRLVYKGDLFKYELLVDSLSVDDFFYIDIEYYDSGTSGSTSLLQTILSDVTDSPSNLVIRRNEWFKITIPLDDIEGKYIKHIHFRSEENLSPLGICTAYFNEVQIINNLDMYNGKQFISCFNYRRVGLGENTIAPPGGGSQWRPIVGIIPIFVDPNTGDPVEWHFSGNIVNESIEPFDSVASGLGTDDSFKWWTNQHTLRYSALLKEVIFFVGIPKTLELIPTEWHGPEPGGSFEVERMFLYPMCDINFVASYSTDEHSPTNNPMNLTQLDEPYNDFINYDVLGFKAWAMQLTARYFDIDESGGN